MPGSLPCRAGCDLVVTTDMIAADVHFLPDDPPETIAQKALRVNLSDLAAQGREAARLYAQPRPSGRCRAKPGSTAFAEGLADGSGAASRSACSAATRSPWRLGRSSPITAFGCAAEGADGAPLRRQARRRALRVRHDRRGRGRARAAEGRGRARGTSLRQERARGADPALPRAGAARRRWRRRSPTSPRRRWMSRTASSATATSSSRRRAARP